MSTTAKAMQAGLEVRTSEQSLLSVWNFQEFWSRSFLKRSLCNANEFLDNCYRDVVEPMGIAKCSGRLPVRASGLAHHTSRLPSRPRCGICRPSAVNAVLVRFYQALKPSSLEWGCWYSSAAGHQLASARPCSVVSPQVERLAWESATHLRRHHQDTVDHTGLETALVARTRAFCRLRRAGRVGWADKRSSSGRSDWLWRAVCEGIELAKADTTQTKATTSLICERNTYAEYGTGLHKLLIQFSGRGSDVGVVHSSLFWTDPKSKRDVLPPRTGQLERVNLSFNFCPNFSLHIHRQHHQQPTHASAPHRLHPTRLTTHPSPSLRRTIASSAATHA